MVDNQGVGSKVGCSFPRTPTVLSRGNREEPARFPREEAALSIYRNARKAAINQKVEKGIVRREETPR
jgi:hypothetical protein